MHFFLYVRVTYVDRTLLPPSSPLFTLTPHFAMTTRKKKKKKKEKKKREREREKEKKREKEREVMNTYVIVDLNKLKG